MIIEKLLTLPQSAQKLTSLQNGEFSFSFTSTLNQPRNERGKELYNIEPTPAQLPANEKEKEVDNADAAKGWNYSVKKAKEI